jgi:hypothetical protein
MVEKVPIEKLESEDKRRKSSSPNVLREIIKVQRLKKIKNVKEEFVEKCLPCILETRDSTEHLSLD